jgi:Tol biopolymer transport system component/DNA-binding winged helix-turn-helix (wHTH) protein
MADFASKSRKVSSSNFSIISQQNLTAPKLRNNGLYEFEDFRLDGEHLMLYKNGETVPLKPKVVETLLALLEKRGEIVSKDELMERLWADTVVEEGNLTQNIYLLRKTLGDAANGKPLIETFWRRGYRFNGEIQEVLNGQNGSAEIKEISQENSSERPTSNRKKLYLTVGAILSLILIGLATIKFVGSKPSAAQQKSVSALKITRLIPDLNVLDSAFTPDGSHLAYTLSEKGKYSVWLKDLTTGSTVQILPANEEGYHNLIFSADGKTLYYGASLKDAPNGTIIRANLADGTTQKITSDVINEFALSPDEKQIAFINDKGRLLLAQTDGSGERILAERDGKKAWFTAWGSNMSWSPDGSIIALCGEERDAEGRPKPQLIAVSTRDGSERIIAAPDLNHMEDAVWFHDQSALLVIARETETAPFQIWRVTYPSGEMARVTNDLNSYDDIALSPDSRQLIAQQQFDNMNLWATSLDAPDRLTQLTFGNATEDGRNGIVFTPDDKIIYTSPRDGNVDLWQMSTDGSEQKQLTKNAGDYNGRPVVTPDGRFIVFTSSRSGRNQIWRMEMDGSNARQLTDADYPAIQPSLSPDGNWVFFKLEDKSDSIWKISIEGGEAERVAKTDHVWSPAVSPDGKLIAYQFYDEGSAKPWKVGVMSAETGETVKTFDVFCFRHLTAWTADSTSLIYVSGDQKDLWQLPIEDGKPSRLTNFENGQINFFAVSANFKQFVLSRGNPSSETVMLQNF